MEAARGRLPSASARPLLLLQATGKNAAAVVVLLMATVVVFFCCPCGGSTRVEEEQHGRYELWTTSLVTVGAACNATIARRTTELADDQTGGVGGSSSAAGDIGREVEWVMMEPETSRRRILRAPSGHVVRNAVDRGPACKDDRPYGRSCGGQGVNGNKRPCLPYQKCRQDIQSVHAMAAYIVTEFP